MKHKQWLSTYFEMHQLDVMIQQQFVPSAERVISMRSNLVPRACDPREGTWGSVIIRCRKPGILAKDWTAHSISTANSANQIPPWNGLSQTSRSFPRIAGSENEIGCAVESPISSDYWCKDRSSHTFGAGLHSNGRDLDPTIGMLLIFRTFRTFLNWISSLY